LNQFIRQRTPGHSDWGLMYSGNSFMSRDYFLPSIRFRYLTAFALWLLLLTGWATGQTTPNPGDASQQPPPSASQPPAPQTSSPVAPDSIESPTPITKAEAKALFRSVDEILRFVSHDTGLPIKHKVKKKLITRDQVERYVEEHIRTDKDAERIERSQLVLRKFGMIPRNYDLHAEFLKLLREQVAAFYDPKTKTVNLLDWVRPELQKPVLAHELTHALQDQSVDLRKWFRAGGSDGAPLPDQQEQVVQEAQSARENVAEGQAMLAMIDYILAPSGLNVVKAPDVVNAMRASMTDGKNLPVLAAAPVYLRESLLMPYAFGMDFERAVLTKKGTTAAYDGVLQHPPADTYEIMVPDAYIDGHGVVPLTIPNLDKLIGPEYERYDFGSMGAFDVYLLAKQYSPETDAKQYYLHWHGGYYLAVHAKSAAKDQIGLIYMSRWDSSEAANAFAKMYSDYVPTRYKGANRLPASCPVPTEEAQCFEWGTSEGTVLIDVRGREVLILEGLDEDTMQRVQVALF
jgi:hypothetical protein